MYFQVSRHFVMRYQYKNMEINHKLIELVNCNFIYFPSETIVTIRFN